MSDSVYNGFLAKVYDYSPYFGKDRKEIVDFYLDALNKDVGVVLELGTATGLTTIPLAKAGYNIDTIDCSLAMHKIVERKIMEMDFMLKKNIQLIFADVSDYKPERKYDVVIMPDSFLLVFLEKFKQKRILRMCYEALEGNGILLFDCFKPPDPSMKKDQYIETTRFRTPDKDVYILEVCHEIHRESQMHICHFKYQKRLENNTLDDAVEVSVSYRYLHYYEMMEMLADVGFSNIKINESFDELQCFAYARKRI